MLQGISWGQYIMFLGSATLIYYIVLFVRGGRKVRFSENGVNSAPSLSFSDSKKRTWRPEEPAANERTDEDEQDNNNKADQKREENLNDRLMPLVHDLVDEFKAFASATEPPVDKFELEVSIAAILRKYPALHDSTFFTAINNLIAVTSEKDWSVHFSEGELAALWKK